MPWTEVMAEIDPEEILRQLPPPEVNYTLPEIRAVKPPVTLPDYSTVEHYGRPRPSTKELERSLEQIKSVTENPAVSSTIKLIKDLSDDKRGSDQPSQSSQTDNPRESKTQPSPTESSTQKPSSNTETTPRPEVVKPPPVEIAPKAPAYPPPTGKLLASWQTLRKNPGLIELEESLTRDRQLVEDTFAMAIQLSADKSAEQGEEGEQPEGGADGEVEGEGEGEDTAPAGSHDAVLATAMGLHKKQDWKGLKNLFQDNPEAGETKDGLRYIIEAEINEAKPNYMQVRRYSNQLLGLDENDAMANYGLAIYYYNASKPDTSKAGDHLAVALKAKNPPEGASAFYWKLTFKKFMIPLLLVIAGLIGGISHVIKKKKAAATIDLDSPAKSETAEAEEKPQGKLMQKLAPLLDKFKGLFARFKKKKAAEPDIARTTSEATATESSEEEVTEADEGAEESEESAEDEESDEEESDEESEDEEEAEEENELESEDEEAVAEDSEEEESEEEESA